jgi:hypothetical protein
MFVAVGEFVSESDLPTMRYFVNRFPAYAGGEVNASESAWLPRIKEIVAGILDKQVESSCKRWNPFAQS